MSNEEMEELYNKLSEIDADLASGLLTATDKYKYLRDIEPSLEGNSDYTDIYSNLEDFIGDRNTRLSKFYNELKGKKPSTARMNSFLDKNADISAKDVNDWFDKTNAFKEYEIERRTKEANKLRRKLEVEGKYTDINNPEEAKARNWGWKRNMLASDYEKQRYIDNPESALFGYDAPTLGKAKETRTGSIADLSTGVAGQVADVGTLFLPFPYNIIANTTVGPLIRTGRDVAHNLTDSPYQDEDWMSDRFKDAAFNATTAGLANARKLAKLAKVTSAPGKVSQALETNVLERDLNKTLSEIDKSKLFVSNDNEWVKMVRDLPESPLKQELLGTISETKGVNVVKARDIMKAYRRDLDPQTYALWKQANAKGGLGAINRAKPSGKGGQLIQALYTNPPPTTFLEQKLSSTPFKDLSKGQKLAYVGLKLVDAINKGNIGSVGLETIRNYNNKDNVEIVDTPERRAQFNTQKEIMKQRYGEYWKNYGKAFAPKKIPGDPLYEAYVEVTGDTLD